MMARRCSITFARHVLTVKYLSTYRHTTVAAYSKPVLLNLILKQPGVTTTREELEREFEELVAQCPRGDEEGPYL